MSRNYRPEGKYQVTSHIAVILLVLILFVSVGFFFFLAKPDEQARKIQVADEFEHNRDLWTIEQPLSFRYVVDRTCDYPAEDSRAYIATEQAGERSARFPIPVEDVSGALIDVPPRPVWIDDILDILQRKIRSSQDVEVRYDTAFGYPVLVVAGPDERYEIRDFEVIDPQPLQER